MTLVTSSIVLFVAKDTTVFVMLPTREVPLTTLIRDFRYLVIVEWQGKGRIEMDHLVIDHIRYLNIVTWLRQNCNFFVSFVPRFPKETWIQIKHHQIIQENQKTRKPRSHIRILIYREWPSSNLR